MGLGKTDKLMEGDGGVILICGSDDGSVDSFLPVKINADGTLSADTRLLSLYQFIDLDDYTTANVTYLGFAKTDGSYLIHKIDETTGTIKRSANKSNNTGKETYAEAWADRVSLNYDYIFNLTSL